MFEKLPENSPRRVVSLLPSMTESLFDLELGHTLVGVTDFCTEPADKVGEIQRVGGTKTPRVDTILALKPELVLANQEENSREAVEELRASGVAVWVTFPKTVRAALDDLWQVVRCFRSEAGITRLRTLEQAYEWASLAHAAEPAVPYFCPIWQTVRGGKDVEWITFNVDTYVHDLLRLLGGENVFAGLQERYPTVTLAEVRAAQPAVVVLPSEPYAFSAEDQRRIEDWLGAVRLIRVEGSLITWNGTRLGRALAQLGALFVSPAH